MKKICISITDETWYALKKEAQKQKLYVYEVAQKILAEATNTKYIFFKDTPEQKEKR